MIASTRLDLVCHACRGPVIPGTRPICLVDLQFHEGCAPTCRCCGSGVDRADEDRWRFGATVVPDRLGFRVEPTDYWCGPCWELSGRDESYAQD